MSLFSNPDLRSQLPLSQRLDEVRAVRQYKLGYGVKLDHMTKIESDFLGLQLAGNYRDGISLTYCIESAVSGAKET